MLFYKHEDGSLYAGDFAPFNMQGLTEITEAEYNELIQILIAQDENQE